MYSEDWKNDVNLNEFWALIEQARNDYESFVATLKRMDRRGLIRVAWLFEDLASPLAQEPYVDSGDSNVSEDFIDDLCEEVVGRGRACYEDVLAHPERMPADVDYSDRSHQMRCEAQNIFFERYGEEIPPYSYDY